MLMKLVPGRVRGDFLREFSRYEINLVIFVLYFAHLHLDVVVRGFLTRI